jgi:hypothetical protein
LLERRGVHAEAALIDRVALEDRGATAAEGLGLILDAADRVRLLSG